MKQCTYCGAELQDDARACNNCGRPVPDMPEPEQDNVKSSAEEAPDRSEAGSASGSESSVAESGEEKPGAIVYIVIGACVAAVIAAGAVLLIHKRK